MSDESFKNFPPHLQREDLVRIVRNVSARPDLENSRMNDEGDDEGLMFDYTKGPENSIRALRPFLDAYRALPIKQIAKEGYKDAAYLLQAKDVRQRLLHELAHLVDIGERQGRDSQAEIFADRVEQAMNQQYVICENANWEEDVYGLGHSSWFFYVFQRKSGNLSSAWDTYTPTAEFIDPETNKGVRVGPRPARPNPYFSERVNQALSNSNSFYVFAMQAAGASPAEYSIVNQKLVWKSRASNVQAIATEAGSTQMDDADTFEVDLSTGRGVRKSTILPSKGDAPDIHKRFYYVERPLDCRTQNAVIEFSDLQ